MRMIDADALKDRLENLAYDDWNQGVTTSWADAYRECADIVEEQPTITPERKRGRWREFQIGKCPLVECTACKMARDRREIPHENGGRVAWKFCPDCGADMREGADG